jgi:tetratricopeptide (TPR) repeat protein
MTRRLTLSLFVWHLAAALASAQSHAPAFRLEAVGPEPAGRPTITNVQIVDLDGDGPPEIIACDAQRQAVFAYRRAADGKWSEQLLGDGLIAPAHVTVVDLDGDGDRDVVVSVMGNLFPDDDVVGSLVLLENVGAAADKPQFAKRILLDDVRRVVDAQPGDFDGDGDVDLAVAVFGYLRGEVLWLENRGALQFRDHQLHAAAGTIHVPVADYDGDGDLDIAAVVSQEDEEVWGFENTGGGKFTSRRLWMTVNFDIGTAGLVAADLDGDRDVDFLLPVGDNLEDSYSLPQPYHGCLWLENQGDWKFAAQRVATFPGTYAAAASDLDADGDQDVALVSMVNHWDEPDAPSLVWLENDGQQEFTQHAIASDPIMLVTVACGDATGDGRPDVVAGGLHVYPPFDRLGRISLWTAGEVDGATPSTAQTTTPAAKLAAEGPPLPDLNMVDELTRHDLTALHQRVAGKVKSGGDALDDWLLLGQSYYAYGFFAAATECFQHAVARSPESSYANFLVGVALERTGRLQEAIDQFRGMLGAAADKSKTAIWHEMGRCYLRLENARSAEDCFVNAGRHAPSLIQLAKLLIQAGRAQEAAAPLNALAELQPHTVEVYLLNARAAEAMGDKKLARTFRDRAEYNSQRMPSDAIAQMVEQVRAQYGAFKLGDQATKLIAEKKWEEAAAVLREDYEASHNRGAAFHLADAELHCGRPEKAVELLEELNAERGTFPPALVVLGDAHLAAGRRERAEQCWLEAADLYPAAEPHVRLATFYEKAGRADDARRHRALALEATGVAKLRFANPSQAVRDFEAAVELDPALPRAWFYLGECRRFLGNAASARTAYEKTIALAPYHGRAIAALDALAE